MSRTAVNITSETDYVATLIFGDNAIRIKLTARNHTDAYAKARVIAEEVFGMEIQREVMLDTDDPNQRLYAYRRIHVHVTQMGLPLISTSGNL